ncbi:programmed cell death protein 2 [Schizophyllum fasciatum]
MPARIEDDWSDSDDELSPDLETSVLLGVPDGPIESSADITDAAVSRIGGRPAFLPSTEPPLAASECKICKRPAELVVQLWCPLEDSPMDRALYVWACARAGCQAKEGSVRAYRGLRYNAPYAEKLAQKAAKKREKQSAPAPAPTPAANPFAMGGNAAAPNPFGLGAQIFGAPPAPAQDEEQGDESGSEFDTDSEHSLVVALASTNLDDSPWQKAPAYPPLYLSTASEYVPPEPKVKPRVPDPDAAAGADLGEFKGLEKYENSLDVDPVFERFVRRVGFEGEQCIRYELGGAPLPFAADAVYDKLFPVPKEAAVVVTKAAFDVKPPVKRTFEPANVPTCPLCGGPRVFECQLMPNLINVLRTTEGGAKPAAKDADARRKEIEQALKGGKDPEARGIDWGTCMVFSCEKDCCVGEDGKDAKDCWREELVMIQADA